VNWSKIPNWLTFLRILIIPVFVAFLIDPSESSRRIATILFIVAAVTDYLDGFLARRMRAVSDLGKLLDPLADKVLVAAALVMLVEMRDFKFNDPFVPGWLVVVILAREFWVTGLRGVAAVRGQIIPASGSGKWKSFLQMVAVVLLLLHDPVFTFLGYAVSAHLVGLNLLVISVVMSCIGAYSYSVQVLTGQAGDVTVGEVMQALRRVLVGHGDPPSAGGGRDVSRHT
jgi:CDP-diacylglycerol--glycerol-3-phosphate 3-phosphatidyltransferase